MSLVTELKISRQDTQLLCAQISDKGDKPSEDFGTHWQSSAIFFFFFLPGPFGTMSFPLHVGPLNIASEGIIFTQ